NRVLIFIAECVSKYIVENGILLRISNETYHIMCQRICIYLIQNIVAVAVLSDGYFEVLKADASYRHNSEIN
ncbi:unnamed protein product, partial [Adineta steineri]